LQISLLKLNIVTEKTNVTLAAKVNELEKATDEITHLRNLVALHQELRTAEQEKYDEKVSELKAKIRRRDATIEELQQQPKSSRVVISTSSRTSSGGSNALTTTNTDSAPRCKDGTLDMRYKVNQGKSKYGGTSSSSGALVSSSYYGGGGGGGGYALTTSDGPRCKDGSYDMRYKCNQGKCKYG